MRRSPYSYRGSCLVWRNLTAIIKKGQASGQNCQLHKKLTTTTKKCWERKESIQTENNFNKNQTKNTRKSQLAKPTAVTATRVNYFTLCLNSTSSKYQSYYATAPTTTTLRYSAHNDPPESWN